MAKKKDDTKKIHVLPFGRLINHSLFERDQYNDEATPSYKVEVAYDAGVLDDFFEELMDAADDEWGKGASDENADITLLVPIKNGDKMAAKREKAGKKGDAYEGKQVIRAKTFFNKHGEKAAGGIAVYDEDKDAITVLNSDQIYRGCMVQIALTIGTYTGQEKDDDGDLIDTNGLTLYLAAVQKVGDGERLSGDGDRSDLFKPVGRKSGRKAKDDDGEGEEDKPVRRRRAS